MADRPAVTELLVAYERGDSSAQEQLFSVVYDELKRIARGHVRRSSGNLTVNPTALVHEAWIKITRGESRQFNDSVHFYNLLAQAMRHVILDLAKRRNTERHGQGFARTDLSEDIEQPDRALDELLAVNAGLVKLQAFDAELAQLVEWHFFLRPVVRRYCRGAWRDRAHRAPALGNGAPVFGRCYRRRCCCGLSVAKARNRRALLPKFVGRMSFLLANIVGHVSADFVLNVVLPLLGSD